MVAGALGHEIWVTHKQEERSVVQSPCDQHKGEITEKWKRNSKTGIGVQREIYDTLG